MPIDNPLSVGDWCEVTLHTGPNRREVVDGRLLDLDDDDIATVRLACGKLHRTKRYHVCWMPSPQQIHETTMAMKNAWTPQEERFHRGIKHDVDESLRPVDYNARDVLCGADGRRVITFPRD